MNPTPNLATGVIKSPESPLHIDTKNLSTMAGISVNYPSFSVDYSGIVHDNQRAIGICTAAHIADALRKIFGFEVSEQFIYWVGKNYIDHNDYEGSSIQTMLQVVYKYGAPRKSLVPTDDTHKSYVAYMAYEPTPEQWADALKQKIAGYARHTDLSWQSLINAGAISATGLHLMLQVGDNFYKDTNGQTDWSEKLSPLRDPRPISSAHAIKCTEGELASRLGLLRNTWGDKDNPIIPGLTGVWGKNGDIDFSYDVQSPYIEEVWVILPTNPIDQYIHTFSTPLSLGMTNSTEVAILQRILARDGVYNYTITGNYGPITAKAVYDFQVKYKVDTPANLKALGGKVVGPLTIAKLNSLYSK